MPRCTALKAPAARGREGIKGHAAHPRTRHNAVERALRLVALGRKNWLFAGSKQAALDAAVFYTLIASCRELGIEPWAYLRDVIKRRAEEPSADPALLSPRAWRTARVAAESPVRAETTSPTV